MEAEAERVFDQIKRLAQQAVPSGDHPIGEMTSGILRGIEDGWFTGEIADAAFAYQRALEKGDKKMVGVNTLADSPTDDLEILRVSHEWNASSAGHSPIAAAPGTTQRSTGHWPR